MKNRLLAPLTLLSLVFALYACAGMGLKAEGPAGPDRKGHPALSEQEKLTPCAECHKDITPDIYEQWYNSGHGLDNVKCFQCHGTYEDLKMVPDTATCAVCHAAQYHKSVQGKMCWECHPAHAFSVHK